MMLSTGAEENRRRTLVRRSGEPSNEEQMALQHGGPTGLVVSCTSEVATLGLRDGSVSRSKHDESPGVGGMLLSIIESLGSLQ